MASGWLGFVLALVALPFLGSGVPDDVWNYPLPGGVHVLVSLLLVVDHLLTAHGMFGVARLDQLPGWAGASLLVAGSGLALLAVCEAVSAAAVGADVDGGRALWLSSGFGMLSLLIAVPTLLAGVAVLHGRLLPGAARASLLVSGLLLLVGVTAANIAGDPVLRSVALALWSLSFVWVGYGLAHTLDRARGGVPTTRRA